MQNKEIEQLFTTFANKKVLIIGDVMIDSYLWGNVKRISPEAPVPLVEINHRENRMGGAANVALNIKALDATPFLCSVIGEDHWGKEFLQLMDKHQLHIDGIVSDPQRITTTKHRIIGNNTQMLRIDEEIDEPLNILSTNALLQCVDTILNTHNINIIIFQDYDKGVINQQLIEIITSIAKERNIPIAVDPKKRNFMYYKGATLFKPNFKELCEGTNKNLNKGDHDRLNETAETLQKKLDYRMIMTTLSEYGIFIKAFDAKNNELSTSTIPAHKRTITDVSGAGDTVISVAALCLSENISPENIACIANIAGGLVCEEVGVVPINRTKLLNETLRLYNN